MGDTTEAADEKSGVDFHAALGLDAASIAQVQAQVRQRTLRAYVRRGLIDKSDGQEMMGWEHGGGFSLDASVCIQDTDRAGLERLLPTRARPPFALEHLHTLDAEHLIYHNPKLRSDSPRNLVLTPLELIDKIAALIPPPRAHRHRYYGVLAPNSPMRTAVTALAPMPVVAPLPVVATETETDSPPHRAASHYLWAMLLARIYETLPLVCPVCQTQMRIIAFITEKNHGVSSNIPTFSAIILEWPDHSDRKAWGHISYINIYMPAQYCCINPLQTGCPRSSGTASLT